VGKASGNGSGFVTTNTSGATTNGTLAKYDGAGNVDPLVTAPTGCSTGQAAQGISTTGAATGCFTPAGTYTLPPATSSTLGGVMPDGTTITNTSGAISVAYGTTPTTCAAGNDSRITGALSANTAASTYMPLTGATLTSAFTLGATSGYSLSYNTYASNGGGFLVTANGGGSPLVNFTQNGVAAAGAPLALHRSATTSPYIVTTGTSENLIVQPNGTGNTVLNPSGGYVSIGGPSSVSHMLEVNGTANISSMLSAGGGSATTLVCWKADGKTLGYATMSGGSLSACN
jgi:hypothetical protein